MHRSFRLAWGTNAPLYAADVVLAATALLEAPPATRAGEGAVRDDRSDCIWCAPQSLPSLSGMRYGRESTRPGLNTETPLNLVWMLYGRGVH